MSGPAVVGEKTPDSPGFWDRMGRRLPIEVSEIGAPVSQGQHLDGYYMDSGLNSGQNVSTCS